MSDIVERLRDSDTTRRIGESYADVHDRRQADRDEAADEITRLRAENERRRAALLDIRNMGPMTVDDQRWRIARAALEEK